MSAKGDSEQTDRLNKLREERIAREKARIEKLREINLKKYNRNDTQNSLGKSISNISVANSSTSNKNDAVNKVIPKLVKNNFHVNGVSKRPISAPVTLKRPSEIKIKTTGPLKDTIERSKEAKPTNKVGDKATKELKPNNIPVSISRVPKSIANTKITADTHKDNSIKSKESNVSRKSVTATSKLAAPKPQIPLSAKKTAQPKTQATVPNSRQSVFERLYKPKVIPKETTDKAVKLQTDPNYLKKVITDSNLILNKRHTVFDTKRPTNQTVRRSISAVHFKRISKNELPNCIHKWASIGEKLNKVNLKDVNEDDGITGDVVSAVKSERKRVQFQTPRASSYNTPRPEELQSRLKSWLQKRGKSLDSFHHLQCFGIHHLTKDIKPMNTDKFELYDDENKENIPVDSDSDDESYTENMNGRAVEVVPDFNKDKWRNASIASDTATDYNESTDTITSSEILHHVDDILLGALNDLTELLREGFDWQQSARWLRAIRDRFPSAPDSAAYWECRAALEETRGDLPASVQCWEEAIAKGTEHAIVEANLDQLLDKFLQLRISPSSGQRRQPDNKMVDVKNVFKSTIIRFAVQQAKLRQSSQSDAQPKFTVTPVRRSGRLSHCRTETPLRICATVKQALELGPAEFVPNRTLTGTP